ncbi:MAG: Ig-like domain-containing protein, partial [Rhodothermales bacterium]|nr:Ig-like domain-containing protein [Rhodothermales bacterium]
MIRSILSLKAIATLAILVSVPPDSVAQFVVTSSSPAHGDTSVPLSVTVSITFSAPIDTTAAFEDTDGFFLNIETIPEIAEPTSIALTPDGMTFTADVVLEADTRYLLLLFGAVSEAGEPLDQPYVATFTTGNSLPTGSVSG